VIYVTSGRADVYGAPSISRLISNLGRDEKFWRQALNEAGQSFGLETLISAHKINVLRQKDG